jgi:hypothetical protein
VQISTLDHVNTMSFELAIAQKVAIFVHFCWMATVSSHPDHHHGFRKLA